MESFDAKGFRQALAARVNVPVVSIAVRVQPASVRVTALIDPPSGIAGASRLCGPQPSSECLLHPLSRLLHELSTFTPASMAVELGVAVEALDPPAITTIALPEHTAPPSPPPSPPPGVPHPASPPSAPPRWRLGAGATAGVGVSAVCVIIGAGATLLVHKELLRRSRQREKQRRKAEEEQCEAEERQSGLEERAITIIKTGRQRQLEVQRAMSIRRKLQREQESRLRIHGHVVGHLVRQKMQALRWTEQRTAAVCVQAYARGFLVRRRARLIARELAAVRIQTHSRMRNARRKYRWLRVGGKAERVRRLAQRWRAMAEATLYQEDERGWRGRAASPARPVARRRASPLWSVFSATAVALNTTAASAMAAAEKLFLPPADPSLPKHLLLCRLRLGLQPPVQDVPDLRPLNRSPTLLKIEQRGVAALLQSTSLGGDDALRDAPRREASNRPASGSPASRSFALPHTVSSKDLSRLPHAFRPSPQATAEESATDSKHLFESVSVCRQTPYLDKAGDSSMGEAGPSSLACASSGSTGSREGKPSLEQTELMPKLDVGRRLTFSPHRVEGGSHRSEGSVRSNMCSPHGKGSARGELGQLEVETTASSAPLKPTPLPDRGSSSHPARHGESLSRPTMLERMPSSTKLATSRFNRFSEYKNVAGQEIATKLIPAFDPSLATCRSKGKARMSAVEMTAETSKQAGIEMEGRKATEEEMLAVQKPAVQAADSVKIAQQLLIEGEANEELTMRMLMEVEANEVAIAIDASVNELQA